MDKGAAKAERGTPAPRGVQSAWVTRLHTDSLNTAISLSISSSRGDNHRQLITARSQTKASL